VPEWRRQVCRSFGALQWVSFTSEEADDHGRLPLAAEAPGRAACHILQLCATPKLCCLAFILQFLVLQLALQFLRLAHLPHGFVEVVLVDSVSVILDCKETSLSNNISQVGTI
jgi:hypothetical protein